MTVPSSPVQPGDAPIEISPGAWITLATDTAAGPVLGDRWPVLGGSYGAAPDGLPCPRGVPPELWRVMEDTGLSEHGANHPADAARELTDYISRLLVAARAEARERVAREADRLASAARESEVFYSQPGGSIHAQNGAASTIGARRAYERIAQIARGGAS